LSDIAVGASGSASGFAHFGEARRVPRDWERMYAHPIYLLETFVDPERFRGTCYRAANWIAVGQTTGRGKNSQSWKPNRSRKQILVLPVHRYFRQLLSQ